MAKDLHQTYHTVNSGYMELVMKEIKFDAYLTLLFLIIGICISIFFARCSFKAYKSYQEELEKEPSKICSTRINKQSDLNGNYGLLALIIFFFSIIFLNPFRIAKNLKYPEIAAFDRIVEEQENK